MDSTRIKRACLLAGGVVLLSSSVSNVNAQCTVSITATPDTLPCGGGPVVLTANSTGGSTFALNNDFNLGAAGNGWSVSPAGQFNNPCGPSLDGTTYMWMGNTTAAPRTLQSAPLDVTCGGDICFDLDFATQGGAAPCEGPDLASEGVYLQYSTNGGATFTDIFYFEPNTATGAYTAWGNYCFPIPPAAQTPTTIFQWYQGGSSGTCCDHWGIDNVTISSTACVAQYYYDWAHVAGSPDSAVQNVTVTNDSTFNIIFTNGVDDTCSNSFTVVTLGLQAPGILTTDEICQFDNDGTATITPVDGVAPYTFDLTGPTTANNTTGAFTNLAPGNYTVTITDSQGCDVQATFVINPGPTCCLFTPSTTSTGVTCFGDMDGVVTVTAVGGPAPYNFTWMDSLGNPLGVTDTFMTNLAAGDYQVQIVDAINCTQILTVNVPEPTEMTMNFSSFDAVCFSYCDGQGIVIPSGGTVAGNYTYIWDTDTSANATTNTLCAGNHSLTVLDDNNCSLDTNFFVNQPAPFVFTLATQDSTLCAGDCNGVIDVSAPGAIDFSLDTTAGWQPGSSFSSLCAGNYTVTVRDAAGCLADTTIDVLQPLPVQLTVSNDTSICTGGTAQLMSDATGGNGNFTYYWDNGLGQGQNQSTTTLGTYSVYALDANNCSTDTLPIVVQQSPALQVAAMPDDEICWGQGIQITAVGSGGDFGPYNYDWDDGSGAMTPGAGQDHYVTPTTTTTYTVTVSDNCGTTPATDQVTITVNPLPDVNMSVDNPIDCTPHSVNFTNLTSPNLIGPECTWWFGQGDSLVDCTGPSFTYTVPGCYDVTLQVTSPEGCVNDTTIDDMVCVWPVPVPDFAFEPQPTTILDPTVYFTNLSSGAVTYEWDFAGLGTSTDDSPSFSFPFTEPGTYPVCLTAYTENGCVRDTCYDVIIGPSFHFYAPNAFTPDGDGINDFWWVQGSGIDPEDFELTIFDRWGNVVFRSTNPEEQWDGYFQGQKAQSDVYVWTVKTRDKWSGDAQEYQGHVTLLK